MHVEDLIAVERQLGYRYEIYGADSGTLPVDLPALPARAGVPGACGLVERGERGCVSDRSDRAHSALRYPARQTVYGVS